MEELLEQARQLDKLELAGLLGAVEWVAHDDLAQLGHRVDITEHAVKQVEQALQVIVGIACRARPKGFEQAFAPALRDRLSAVHSLSPALYGDPEAARQPVPWPQYVSSLCQPVDHGCIRFKLTGAASPDSFALPGGSSFSAPTG